MLDLTYPKHGGVSAGNLSQKPLREQDLDDWLANLPVIGKGGFGEVLLVGAGTGSENQVLKRLPTFEQSGIACPCYSGSDAGKVCTSRCRDLSLKTFRLERDILWDISQGLSQLPSDQSHLRVVGETHIIKLIDSFSTPLYHCLLLSPVALCNLYELLEAYCTSQDHVVSIRSNQVGKGIVTEWLHSYFPVLAATVHCIHYLEIRHGDITPKNILCGTINSDGTTNGTLRLCDFGIAHQLGGALRSPPCLMYNRTWTSPERLYGPRPSYKDDVYYVGLVFLEIYTVLKGRTLRSLEEFLDMYVVSGTSTEASIPIRESGCMAQYARGARRV